MRTSPRIHSSRRTLAAATALVAVTAFAGQSLVGSSAGAGDLAAAVAPSGSSALTATLARLTALPGDRAGDAAVRVTASSIAADPLAALGAPIGIHRPTVVADAALSAFPNEFRDAVLALEQAALVGQSLTAHAFDGVRAGDLATIVHDGQAVMADVQARAENMQHAANAGDAAGVTRERDALAADAPNLVPARDVALARTVDTAALVAAARVLDSTARAELPVLTRYGQAHAAASATGSPNTGASNSGSCSRPGPIYCDSNNLVEIWGTGNDTYTSNSVAKIRIDLGGNDTYHDQTATAVGDASKCDVQHPSLPCVQALGTKMNIDVSGNDHYVTQIGQGVGELGVGVLVDGAGADTYSALIGQGFAAAGAGVLDDLSGDDHYDALAFGHGAALIGAGVLADGNGDDVYNSLAGAQGVGLVGAGLLADAGGNDVYRCLAICQGSALLGGGAVVDTAGNDLYTGLDLGIIRIPGAITQAASIGLGAGAVVDLAGNDTYGALTMGMAMAQSANLVTALVKKKQTDTFALFFDGQGTDSYTYVGKDQKSFGQAVGYALSRFVDAGSSADTYAGNNHKPANNTTWVMGDGTSTWLLDHDLGQPNGSGRDG